jgi:hypothetical protein
MSNKLFKTGLDEVRPHLIHQSSILYFVQNYCIPTICSSDMQNLHTIRGDLNAKKDADQ